MKNKKSLNKSQQQQQQQYIHIMLLVIAIKLLISCDEDIHKQSQPASNSNYFEIFQTK